MDWTIDGGDLVRAVSVLVSASGLMAVALRWRIDRRRSEAVAIRAAAGRTVARLERWTQIATHQIDELHPAFVDADQESVEGTEPESIRDELWSKCFESRQQMRRRVLDEELELAYVDLYGYDQRIQAVYEACTSAVRTASEKAFELLTLGTQEIIVRGEGGRPSSALGNELRKFAACVRSAFSHDAAMIVGSLRSSMLDLAHASDTAVLSRTALGPSFSGESLQWQALQLDALASSYFARDAKGADTEFLTWDTPQESASRSVASTPDQGYSSLLRQVSAGSQRTGLDLCATYPQEAADSSYWWGPADLGELLLRCSSFTSEQLFNVSTNDQRFDSLSLDVKSEALQAKAKAPNPAKRGHRQRRR